MNEEEKNKAQEQERKEEPVEESLAAKRLAHFEPDIHEGDGAEAVLSREPGFLGWVKHTWFYHRFAILVTVFALLVGAVCLHQCNTRNAYDVNVLYAGPWFSCDDASVVSGINEAFAGLMQDYDGNGQKNVAYTPLFLLSDEQLTALRKENEGKAEEDKIYISSKLLADNREMLDAGVMTGEMTLCLLDPTIYRYFRDNNLVDELSHYIDESLLPEGSAVEGYGIMLKETDFGRYFGVLKSIPEDTILCVRRAGVMNQAWSGEGQAEARARYGDLLTAVLSFRAP